MPFTGPGASISISGGVTAEMDRKVTKVTLTIANGASVSGEVDMRDYSGGVIYMPAAWTTADLGAKVAHESGGTFQTLKDRENGFGTDVSIDAAGASACYPTPSFWFGSHYLQLFSHDGTGSATVQGAERSIVLMLKS